MTNQKYRKKGFNRIGFIVAFLCAIGNFLYAVQEGLKYSWSYISCGNLLQKAIGSLMVKIYLGGVPDLAFIAIHSFLVFLVIRITYQFMLISAFWIGTGFKKVKSPERIS